MDNQTGDNMKIRASKKYIQGIDMLVKNAQKFAEDVVNLPEGEIDQRFVKFTVDMWRAVENYRYIIKRADTDDEVILLADGEGNSGAFVDDDKDLVENSETVASFLIELKDEYAGYSVSICDMDGNEEMHFILLQETDFDYLSSIGYKEVLNSKIFAWNIDDDEGEEEIYIEIEEQDKR